MTAQNLVGQTQKNGWAKKLGGPINWVDQILNWVGIELNRIEFCK